MEEKATEKQIEFGKSLKIEGIENMTKQQAKVSIDLKLNPPTEEVVYSASADAERDINFCNALREFLKAI